MLDWLLTDYEDVHPRAAANNHREAAATRPTATFDPHLHDDVDDDEGGHAAAQSWSHHTSSADDKVSLLLAAKLLYN